MGLWSTAPLSGGCCTGLASVTKKDLQAREQKRNDVADLRRILITKRQPIMAKHLDRLTFIPSRGLEANRC